MTTWCFGLAMFVSFKRVALPVSKALRNVLLSQKGLPAKLPPNWWCVEKWCSNTSLHIFFCFPLECEGLVQFERLCLECFLGEICHGRGWMTLGFGPARSLHFCPRSSKMFVGIFCTSWIISIGNGRRVRFVFHAEDPRETNPTRVLSANQRQWCQMAYAAPSHRRWSSIAASEICACWCLARVEYGGVLLARVWCQSGQ